MNKDYEPQSVRHGESGWARIGRIDKARRRSFWLKYAQDGSIELCAGREGDDAYVKVARDNPCFQDLFDVLDTARYAFEEPKL